MLGNVRGIKQQYQRVQSTVSDEQVEGLPPPRQRRSDSSTVDVSCCTHFRQLQWKNVTVKRRAWCGSLTEMLVPVVVFLILHVLRAQVEIESIPEQQLVDKYGDFLPSISMLDPTSFWDDLMPLPCGRDLQGDLLPGNGANYVNSIGLVNPPPGFVAFLKTTMKAAAPLSAFSNFTCQGKDNRQTKEKDDGVVAKAKAWTVDLTAYVEESLVSVFDSEAAMMAYVEGVNYGSTSIPLLLGITFDTTGPEAWGYRMRVNATLGDTRNKVDPLRQSFLPQEWAKFLDEGYGIVQALLDYYILASAHGLNPAEFKNHGGLLNVNFAPFPIAEHDSDSFAHRVGGIFLILATVAFLWPFTRLVRNIVHDKETRLSEGLRMVGVDGATLWLSWWATYSLLLTGVSIAVTVVLAFIFTRSASGLVFLWIFAYCLSLASMATVFAAVFSNSKTAGLYATLLYFVSFMPYMGLHSAGFVAKIFASLLSPVAFALSGHTILRLEEIFTGLRMDSWLEPVDDFPFGVGIAIMVLDSVLYLGLAWYLDQVVPSEHRTSKALCFPCRQGPRHNLSGKDELGLTEQGKPASAPRSGVTVRGLRKVYSAGSCEGGEAHVAVEGLDLNMAVGQIFVLLGHNGAGKTTTINMLTGETAITAGYAKIFGLDVGESAASVRRVLGACSQQDILVPTLTVAEHLALWARLKGVLDRDLMRLVQTAIEEVGLTLAAHQYAASLSGGQKRRLSLAMALIGNPKASRRDIWNLLMRKKKGRVIVLTTHFMDEADHLGDRIAIMHQGYLKCVGTPLFLKSQYGVGYNITLTKAQKLNATLPPSEPIFQLIQAHVSRADVLSDSGAEVSLRLPLEDTPNFPLLFEDLDKQCKDLGVESYGLSVTTMEEVFLRVAAEAKEIRGGDSGAQQEDTKHLDMPVGLLSSKAGFWRQFRALIAKRYHIFKRDRRALLFQLLLPLLIMVLGLSLLRMPEGQYQAVTSLDMVGFDSPHLLPHNIQVQQPDGTVTWAPAAWLQKAPDAKTVPLSGSTLSLFSAKLLENRLHHAVGTHSAFFCHSDPTEESKWKREGGRMLPSTTIFTNYTVPLGIPIFLNLYTQAILNFSTPGTSLAASLQPFPQTRQEKDMDKHANGFFAALVVTLAFAFSPCSYIVFIVKERESNAKHLQVISGVNIYAYWLSNYVWDLTSFSLTAFICCIWVRFDDAPSLNQGEHFTIILVAVTLYGLSVISFTYLCSFLFKSASTAQNTMIMVYVVAGILMTIVSFVLNALKAGSDDKGYLQYVSFFFRLFPNFCLGDTIFFMSLVDTEDPWAWDVSGYNFLFMALEFFGYSSFVLLLESPLVRALAACVPRRQMAPLLLDPLDVDVRAERDGIRNGDRDGDLIRLEGLRKAFGDEHIAVSDLYFSIPKGQCFGFLGVNGAGKSTTLKMLTGDLKPSGGTAFLGELDMLKRAEDVRSLMGYCPQADALDELLTAEETLQFYARLRGVPEAMMPATVSRMCARLTLTQSGQHRRPCGTYSGGNKRKLSVAIALIGSPPIVFLDEPSTGMDPVSRRQMWNFISETMAGRAVILTTHSMEECEALCQRIGVLVKGELKALGTSQHLKTRFGQGFQVTLNVSKGAEDRAMDVIRDIFKEVELLESIGGVLKLRCEGMAGASGMVSCGRVFAMLEAKRGQAGILDYAVSQMTLEQIFLALVEGEGLSGDKEGPTSAAGHWKAQGFSAITL